MVDLPDRFTVEDRGLLTTYRVDVWRDAGGWMGQTTITKGLTPDIMAPEEMDREHAETLYTDYEVIAE